MKKSTILQKCILANEFTANAEQRINLAIYHNEKAVSSMTKLAVNIVNLRELAR